jgi:acyl carrier protein
MEDRMSIKATILSQIEKVAAEQNKTLAPLTDDLALLESGMDSLCFAILVTRLEDVTGSDPFTAEGDIKFPETVAELIALYEHAAA